MTFHSGVSLAQFFRPRTDSKLALRLLGVTLVAGLGVGGCKDKAAVEPAPNAAPSAAVVAASAAPAVSSAAGATAAVKPPSGVVWPDPASWKRVTPSSAMRKASYQIPAAAGDKEDAELAVFYFGVGQGGSVDANVQRWVGQFSGVAPTAVERSERTVGELKAHLVEIGSGTFTDSMAAMHGGSGEAKANYSLLGAIVETAVGPYFFKLTGPKKTVAAAKADFMQLLEGIHAE